MEDKQLRGCFAALEVIDPHGAKTRILAGSTRDAMRLKQEIVACGWRVSPAIRVTRMKPVRPVWEQVRAVEILDRLKKGKLKPKSEIQT